MKKAYDDMQLLSANIITYVILDEYAFKAFNCFAYK